MIERKIGEDGAGQRLDKFVRKVLRDVPLGHIFKMFRTKKVRVNGTRGRPEQLLAAGDVVTIRGDEEKLLAARPESEKKPHRAKEPLKVYFEDDYLMAVEKPAGMAVHPGSGIVDGTLVDEVRAMLGPHAVHNDFAPSPAHRLDRDTSGVILVAKRRRAMVRLTEIFTEGSARKTYLALAKGTFPQAKGTIDLPLSEHEQTARSKDNRGVNMQAAVTHWRVLAKGPGVTLLECHIETGRTHQIRRHLVAMGHPVAGDRRYGDFPYNRELKAKFGLKRMFLHARRMIIAHPISDETMTFDSPLPQELTDALKRMGIEPPP
ncbi:MAG TPA: RluA family pseudouridine synthase [Myxococcales bacterium]|jgi:23S rRNA pseudouridine955/2504/2580 synthase